MGKVVVGRFLLCLLFFRVLLIFWVWSVCVNLWLPPPRAVNGAYKSIHQNDAIDFVNCAKHLLGLPLLSLGENPTCSVPALQGYEGLWPKDYDHA